VPWRLDQHAFKAWKQGMTGYPLIDAGMKQLWSTGWAHNRARVICGGFLVKHLLLPWQWGLKHFWDVQLDADLECDALGWQYVSGCMSDAPPFSHIMDLGAEAARFDPDGEYVRRWLPVLSRLPLRYIHAPWTAPPEVLAAADVELGFNYPFPIVTAEEAKERVAHACSVVEACCEAGSVPRHPYRPATDPSRLTPMQMQELLGHRPDLERGGASDEAENEPAAAAGGGGGGGGRHGGHSVADGAYCASGGGAATAGAHGGGGGGGGSYDSDMAEEVVSNSPGGGRGGSVTPTAASAQQPCPPAAEEASRDRRGPGAAWEQLPGRTVPSQSGGVSGALVPEPPRALHPHHHRSRECEATSGPSGPSGPSSKTAYASLPGSGSGGGGSGTPGAAHGPHGAPLRSASPSAKKARHSLLGAQQQALLAQQQQQGGGSGSWGGGAS